MRAMGIDIKSLPLPQEEFDEPNVAYILRAGDFYLPYLELTAAVPRSGCRIPGVKRLPVSDDDVALLDRVTRVMAEHHHVSLGGAAASARRKLGFDLPLSERAIERVLSAPIVTETANVLEVLQAAVTKRLAVRCRYYSIGRDSEEARVIEPYGLFFSWGHWYCVAHCRERGERRVFRVDRMSAAKLMKGEAASFEVPEDFCVRDYVGRPPWELTLNDPTNVRVRFRFPESRWVQAQGVGRVIEPLTEDGGAILEFAVRGKESFLRWLLTFRGNVEVMEPESVAGALDDLRERVAAVYRTEKVG